MDANSYSSTKLLPINANTSMTATFHPSSSISAVESAESQLRKASQEQEVDTSQITTEHVKDCGTSLAGSHSKNQQKMKSTSTIASPSKTCKEIMTRRNAFNSTRRTSIDHQLNRKAASKTVIYALDQKLNALEESTNDSQSFSSSEPEDDINPLHSQDISFNSFITASVSTSSRRQCSLSDTYQPKVFEDIFGHEINIKALSNAIHHGKIAPLYLFHGPGGTGKTSTARVFAMASNCESTSPSPKPCWSCRGCSRSLYITELCSGSRSSGFDRIRTLLQSTAFTWSISGYKVFIIEECHLLAEAVWEELLSLVESGFGGSSVVFIMITENANKVPRMVLSRCQKFSFQKLKDVDVALKLARIVGREEIRIGKDALRLITAKADGSLREAENILGQLCLLGSKITTSMVQQLVGLVPHNKLIALLEMAISRDAAKMMRYARELIASGTEPQALISQLASVITDILSTTPSSLAPSSSKDEKVLKTQAQLTYNQPERLCHALKILLETEKHMQLSSDHATWSIAALLQIASDDTSKSSPANIVLPKDILSAADRTDIGGRQSSTDINWSELFDLVHNSKTRTPHLGNGNSEQPNISEKNNPDLSSRSVGNEEENPGKMVQTKPNWPQMSDMEMVWEDILGRIHNQHLREFLCQEGQLISLTISRANAIVHLMFRSQENKLAAEISEETIAKALSLAFGYPVTVYVSLTPSELEVVGRISVSKRKNQVPNPRHSGQQTKPSYPTFKLPPHNPDSKGPVLRRSSSQRSAFASEKNTRPTRLQDSMQRLQNSMQGQEQETSLIHGQQIPPFSGRLNQGISISNEDPETVPCAGDKATIRGRQRKHRWHSLSLIQHADASVEPYSQDLFFENAKIDKQQGIRRNTALQKSSSRGNEHSAPQIGLSRSRSCSNMFRRGKIMVKGGVQAAAMTRRALRWTSCKSPSSLATGRNKKAQLDLRKTVPTS